jgi:aminoglycoside phosphotransferase
VERLRHGYTNRTRIADGYVEKRYDGPRASANAARELACLTALDGRLPTATVVEADLSVPRLRMTLLPGEHGQDLIEDGHASQVLRLVGQAVATLQQLPPDAVPDLAGDGPVIVHGDFGPQNMLFDLGNDEVSGIVDWESAHRGDQVEDLAWTEWLVRMHHGPAVEALDELFAGACSRPPWPVRHDAMLRRVRDLVSYCEANGIAADWRFRLDVTERWNE